MVDLGYVMRPSLTKGFIETKFLTHVNETTPAEDGRPCDLSPEREEQIRRPSILSPRFRVGIDDN